MGKVAVVITYGFKHRAAVVLAKDWDEAINYIKFACEHELKMYNELNKTDAALEYMISEDGAALEYMISEDGAYAEFIAHRDDMDDVTTWRIGDMYELENVLHE